MPATDAVALQNKADIQTSLRQTNKHKSLETVKDKLRLAADEAADAKADVKKAKELRKQAQIEATEEER
jgi:BioD-like phosphotransacetylase family protein